MNDLWRNEQFCADLTTDVVSDEELSRLCAQSIQVRRHRTQFAAMLRAVAIIAFFTSAMTFLRKPSPPPITRSVVSMAAGRSVKLIKSERFEKIIRSEGLTRNREFFATLEPVLQLQSPVASNYRSLSDEELFLLFPGRAVALVKRPGGGVELEFLDNPSASPF